MQTTININGKSVEITLTPEQVAQITEAAKPKLFGYDEGNTYFLGTETISEFNSGKAENSLKQGRYRRTKEAALMDFKRQTRMMRLSALAWEVGECVENGGYCVFKLPGGNKYSYGFIEFVSPSEVYMTQETATKVCEILNSGEYSLDVD
jgi:hypothetical protein